MYPIISSKPWACTGVAFFSPMRVMLVVCIAASAVLLPLLVLAQNTLHPAHIEILTDQHYFSGIQQRIAAASKSIKVMMFEASYYPRYARTPTNMLIQELIAARTRGVAVEVILERGADLNDRTTKANLETARLLNRGGVEVFLDPEDITTHTKVIIIDDLQVVIGSANWTYSAMKKNHEASVVIYSDAAAEQMGAYFETVKKKGIHFKSFD
jgi:phosphatidylserine/phosphatidylglycerophosphate/cardiolipin synthase-like enzyme